MGAVYFYHITRSPLDVTLTALLQKSRARGWRVVVRGTSSERMEWLDERLWTHPEESFLAHGLAGGADAARHPVLLTTGAEVDNGAACLLTIDGAAPAASELAAFERVCILFDGNDPAAVALAREQWRALTATGASAQYWSEAGGHWEKKAETQGQGGRAPRQG